MNSNFCFHGKNIFASFNKLHFWEIFNEGAGHFKILFLLLHFFSLSFAIPNFPTEKGRKKVR